jgi:hypothetical protein
LAWVALDSEPAASKKLDVSTADSQVTCNGTLREINPQALFPSRPLIALAFARASALLEAPHA